MKKTYVSPTFKSLALQTNENILQTSTEEELDIVVPFDSLWSISK